MHIAICVWGIVRSLRVTLESIQHHCLNPIINAGHTYEIYMHTYKFSGVYVNKRNNEHVRLNFSEWKMLNPDHIYVEDQDLFDANTNYSEYHSLGDPWHNDYKSSINHIRALNSLHYLASEVEKDSKFKHFDGVVYLRPDVTYLNELPIYLLEHIPNTLFMPDFHRSCKGGEYNDRMAMGDLKSGLLYGKRFESALDYSKTALLHSEKFTYNYLHANNVTVMEIPFRFRRTRANGQFHVRDKEAIVAPRNQKAEPEYTTFFALRWIYTLMEIATEHKVYIWNHDDNENLYCKPHPYISLEQCREYRKISRRKRLDAEAGIVSRAAGSPQLALPSIPDPEGAMTVQMAPKAQYKRHYLTEPSAWSDPDVPKPTEFTNHEDQNEGQEQAQNSLSPPQTSQWANEESHGVSLYHNSMQEDRGYQQNTGLRPSRLKPHERNRAGRDPRNRQPRFNRGAKFGNDNNNYMNSGYKSQYDNSQDLAEPRVPIVGAVADDPTPSLSQQEPPHDHSRTQAQQAQARDAPLSAYHPSHDNLEHLQRDLQRDAALGLLGRPQASHAPGGSNPGANIRANPAAPPGGPLALGNPGTLGEAPPQDHGYKLRGMASRELEERESQARLKKARHLRTKPG